MAFRLVLVSDTHLSDQRPWFAPNFVACRDWVRDTSPDLVLNLGDMAFEAPLDTADLTAARDDHDALGVPWRAIPGNHDIGDGPRTDGAGQRFAVNAGSRALWADVIGPEWWTVEAGAWTLIGLNTQLFGTGDPAEKEQEAFLDVALATAAGRPILLATHRPWFLDRIDEPPNHPGRWIWPETRDVLWPKLKAGGVRAIVSGHVHQHRHMSADGIELIWAPSTAFHMPDDQQPAMGLKRLGLLDLRLESDGSIAVDFVEPDGITQQSLTEFPDAY